MRVPACISLLCTAFLAAAPVAIAGDGRPERVVSMNLCTDQLAMLIAAPGQLHSVSWLAVDPDSSALAKQAEGLALNRGQAEEIFLMQPDLVIAGVFTTHSTVELLRRIGIRVELFGMENSFDDIRRNITHMGEVLGRRERADEVLAAFEQGVGAFANRNGRRPVAATYFPNSYTEGAGTLFNEIVTASGLDNVAARMGYTGLTRMPLETLILADPEVLINSDARPSMPALAHQNLDHPAYRALAQKAVKVDVPSAYTICGGPFTAEAIRILQNASEKVPPAP